MKKFLTILCLAGLLTGCGVVDEPESDFSEAATESEADAESPVTTKKVTEPTNESSVRQLDSHIKEIDLSLPENSDYRQYETVFTYGNEYKIANWGKIIEDKDIFLESPAGERTALVTVSDIDPLCYAKICGVIDPNRFYYCIIEEEFTVGFGVYDLLSGEDFRADNQGYAPIGNTQNSIILKRGIKSELNGYARLSLDSFELTDIALPDIKDGHHLTCSDLSPNGRAAASITESSIDGDYEYTVSVMDIENGVLLGEYSFVTENDYVSFDLQFVTDNEIYLYAYQSGNGKGDFLYIITLDGEVEDISPTVDEETPTSLRERVIAEYKSAIQSKIDLVYALSGPNQLSIDYALYDMDKDEIPELLLKYGTCEADYQIVIYTYMDGQLKELVDNISGGHTSFAYDYVADQLVLSYGHMGHGEMSWYDLDENGELRFLISTGSLDYNDLDGPTYYDYMKQYNVEHLDLCAFFQIGDMKKTWVYRPSTGGLQKEECEEFDYTFLENYQF